MGEAKSWLDPAVDRREFIKMGMALASALALAPSFLLPREALGLTTGENPPDPVEEAENLIYSVCQNCHSRCGIRAKVKDGILLKIDGNPYHPNNLDSDEEIESPRLPYSTDTAVALATLGRLCLKGQAGIQTLYDPYRVKGPLKRVGPRGSGQWKSISWEQALTEIADRINQLIPPDQRKELIDPAFPELGPKANQLVFSPGRTVEGAFFDRIWKNGFGTVNFREDHTSICEVPHHVGNDFITWDPAAKKGRKNHFKPDILNSEFILYFGANPLEANFPMLALARKTMRAKRKGLKYVLVDPRLSHSAAQANWEKGGWVPILPGTDAALALGMARWILDNERYDRRYLENTTKAAAGNDGETTFTDAPYLVKFEAPEKRYLRADEAGLGGSSADYVVWSGGEAKSYQAVDHGELDPGVVEVNGIRCKTVFTLFKERSQDRTLEEYADLCGVSAAQIADLAAELTRHGKKAVANAYRGVVMHTNGVYNLLAVMSLNTLIGNYDWKGGNAGGGGGWSELSGLVNLTKVPGGASPTGIRINRVQKSYEKDAPNLFARDGYPARRPWFPYGNYGNYQEVIPSAAQGYPYPIKVLITYWNAWPYSTPGLKQVFLDAAKDESKLPLFVAISLNIGETAAWADYILPDTSYLEKFAFPGMTPTILTKATSYQQPVVGSFDQDKNYLPILPDTKMAIDILIELAKKLGLPGVGAGAFEDGSSLDRAWDWARKQLENLAKNSSDALGRTVTVEEIQAKGGVFEDPGREYEGEHLRYKYGNIIRLYSEELATTKDSITGQYYDGLPQYEPIQHSDGSPVEDSSFPLRLITYKSVRHGQARTATSPWLMMLSPENAVEMNRLDAQALGIATGDRVRVTSPSNSRGVVGRAWVKEGIRPGVVAISHHFGHWELHSHPIILDGKVQGFDPSRGAGIQPNLIMRLDQKLGDVSLQDKIGAGISYFDTRVKVEKVTD